MGAIVFQGNSHWKRLHPSFLAKVRKWVSALSHDVYVVNNGSWRSHWRQFVLWFKYSTGMRSVPANFPGTSAHNVAGRAMAIDVHPAVKEDGYDEMHAKAGQFGLHFASNEKWHLEDDSFRRVPKWVAVVGYLLWVLVFVGVKWILLWLIFKRKGVR